MESLTIIGAGEAGTRAALHLRERSWDGEIILISQESHTPYERPPLSKSVINEGVSPPLLSSAEQLQELHIKFLQGRQVANIDRQSHQLRIQNDEWFSYDKLLLATGASARRLTCTGSEHALVLRHLDEALALRSLLAPGKHLILIGAGFIGLELAVSARKVGCEVTVLEMAPRILGRAVPPEVAEAVASEHKQQGVKIRCDVQLDHIQALKSGYTVKLKNGESITGDLVVAGIGAVPEIALAEAASLDIENGVSVNAFLQTSDPDIYAIGDCCSFPHPLYEKQRMRLEMWRCARDQAECAVQNLLGKMKEFSAVPWFWSDQFELSLQVVGLPSFAKRVIPRTRPDGVTIYFGLNDQERLVSAAGVGTGNSVAKDIRLAEMLIAVQKTMNPVELSDPNLNLKKLLKN